MAAFSFLPSTFVYATADNPSEEIVLAMNLVQQQRTVKGVVVDVNGEPIVYQFNLQ